MVHDLDLIAIDREDVLFAGVGVGVLTRGHARRVGVSRLVADGADVALFNEPLDGVGYPARVFAVCPAS